jgi:hypothetical protein
MIRPLIGLHLKNQGRKDGSINPPNIPVFFFIRTQLEVCLVSAVLEDLVLRVTDVDAKRIIRQRLGVEVSCLAYQLPADVLQNVSLVS